jgi:DNA-binding response OmpR family regulator
MPKKILIIDDEQAIVKMLIDRLNVHGFDTISASDGETGFDKACRYFPDIILLDVMMPGWSGFETANRLSQDSSTANIPIIFLTGLSSESISRKYLEKGKYHVLLKPFKVEELLDILSKDFGM